MTFHLRICLSLTNALFIDISVVLILLFWTFQLTFLSSSLPYCQKFFLGMKKFCILKSVIGPPSCPLPTQNSGWRCDLASIILQQSNIILILWQSVMRYNHKNRDFAICILNFYCILPHWLFTIYWKKGRKWNIFIPHTSGENEIGRWTCLPRTNVSWTSVPRTFQKPHILLVTG